MTGLVCAGTLLSLTKLTTTATDLQEHDVEYCDFNEFTATLMTWNAGACKPSSLRHDQIDDNFFREFLTTADAPDIFIFGFQELVDLEDKKMTAKSFFKAAKKHKDKDKDKEQSHHHDERMSHQYRAWFNHLARCIDENITETYQSLHTANLIGLFTCIFVKDSFRNRVSNLDSAQIKTGMGGLHGNKGALVVRFLVDDSSICLLNCHLAAGQSHTGNRNKDLAVILDSAPLSSLANAKDVPLDAIAAGGDGSMALDHEVCILAGDLNYRIDSMPRDAVVAAIRSHSLSTLLARDQLLGSRRRNPGHRLRGWEEKPITFAPTYKYDVGTDNYDTSEKKRSPAWCDRILYRGLGRVKMDSYRRWESPKTSDHRPVSGQFRIRVKTVLPEKREAVEKEGEKRFDAVVKRVAGDVM
jgi:endonuclease/exonuclease/phosphatase family metal-dependent hydrolase